MADGGQVVLERSPRMAWILAALLAPWTLGLSLAFAWWYVRTRWRKWRYAVTAEHLVVSGPAATKLIRLSEITEVSRWGGSVVVRTRGDGKTFLSRLKDPAQALDLLARRGPPPPNQ